MNVMIPLNKNEKEMVVAVLREQIGQYRETLTKPDVEGESASYRKSERWNYTRKLETLVAALTKIEAQVVEAGK